MANFQAVLFAAFICVLAMPMVSNAQYNATGVVRGGKCTGCSCTVQSNSCVSSNSGILSPTIYAPCSDFNLLPDTAIVALIQVAASCSKNLQQCSKCVFAELGNLLDQLDITALAISKTLQQAVANYACCASAKDPVQCQQNAIQNSPCANQCNASAGSCSCQGANSKCCSFECVQ